MEYRDLTPVVEGVAHGLMRTFYKYIEREDLSQELWLWVYSHGGRIAEKLEEDEGRIEGWLHNSLRNAGLKYAQEIKAQVLGYSTADLYYWNNGEIKALLPDMFDYDKWLDPPVFTDEQGNRSANVKPPHEGGNWIATLADLSRAYAGLEGKDKEILRRIFQDGERQVDLADEYGVAQSTISAWQDRAVGRLLKALGGRQPRGCPDDCECGGQNITGSRRVMSNAEALARTGSEWNGD